MFTYAELHARYMAFLESMERSNLQPRYNVCPTTKIDVVTANSYHQMRWGLVPGWWSKPLKELRLATFNARAETVEEKPFFRQAFKSKRCIIPVSEALGSASDNVFGRTLAQSPVLNDPWLLRTLANHARSMQAWSKARGQP